MASEQEEYLKSKEDARATRDYRAFVGPPEKYDVVGANQFGLLVQLGLREHHYLLDIGCGSLRAGRLFMSYLLPGRYFGIEPEQWLIDEGIARELGEDVLHVKRPTFSNDKDFTLSQFGRPFDFIVAHSIFSHASSAQIQRCMSEAGTVMAPGAVLAATFLPGPRNYMGPHWAHRANYTLSYLRELAAAQGLLCEPIRWPHPNRQTWLVIFEKEHEETIRTREEVTTLLSPRGELAFPAKGFPTHEARGRMSVSAAGRHLRRRFARLWR